MDDVQDADQHSHEVLRGELEEMLKGALLQLEKHAGAELAKRVTVIWNHRMRSAAGRAAWPDARVELNPRLLSISLAEVRRTLMHELAHLLAFHRAGRRKIAPHGREWQRACADLGIPGEGATHLLPLPAIKQRKRWRYQCPHCSREFDRARRISPHSACYVCCRAFSGGKYHNSFRLKEIYLG